MARESRSASTAQLQVVSVPDEKTGVHSRYRLKTALLLHQNPAKRAAISDALASNFEILETSTSAEALETLANRELDLVIADARFCGKPLLTGISEGGLSGRCVFLSSPSSASRLIDGFSRGHAFAIVDDTEKLEELKREIAATVLPRSATRHTIAQVVLETRVRGAKLTCPVIDISNYGCAISLKTQEPLYPGTFIEDLCLRREGTCVLEGVAGIVRHLDVLDRDGDELRFLAGVEFAPQASHPEKSEEGVLDDPVVIVASLKAALRSHGGGVYLDAPGLAGARIQARGGDVELESSRVTLLIESAPAWRPGDVCRGVFELGGMQYVFWSSLLAFSDAGTETSVSLTLPRAIMTRRRRNTQRFRPPFDQAVKVSLASPFDELELTASTLDITASGASFAIDDSQTLLPVGTVLPEVALSFPHGATFVSGARVRSLHPLKSSGSANLKCGIEFVDHRPTERAELADYIVRCVRPEVSSGLDSSFEEIWAFLKESGFLYPEKLKHLNEDSICASMQELLGRPNDVFKTWLCKADDRIVAHISAIRLFGSTWGVQHLAASPNRDGISRGRLLNMALTEYCEQHPKIEWVRICYRPTNLWPARIFGTYAQKMVDRELSELRTFSYLAARTYGIETRWKGRGITIRPFAPEDLTTIEAFFVSRGRTIQLRAADISTKGILLESLNSAYLQLGLFRRREVVVAERHGEMLGFALAEMSSPGLNLSELTNSASIYLLEDDPEALKSLSDALRELYARAGRDECILLAEEKHVPSLLDYGFKKHKEYCCWTWHRSLWRRFYEHSVRAFG